MIGQICLNWSYKAGDMTHCELASHSKVGELGVTLCVEQNVAGLDVAVDLPALVQILQTFQCIVQDGRDLIFCQL